MSTGICSCNTPTFGNMGRPNCVIEQKTMAFPILVPRYKANGDRFTIDVSSGTVGADVQALLLASLAAQNRMYPFPRVENVVWERSDTVNEVAPSGRTYKIDGVGGVYKISFETWAKDAVSQIMREALKFGCSDFDMFYVSVDGNLWGILDNPTDTLMRGYEVATETYDSFIGFATDTTVTKGMFSFELDNAEAVEKSYAITAGELGYKATTLVPNQSASIAASALTNTTCQAVVTTGFGSANDRDNVVGLVAGDFTVENTDVPAGDIIVSLVESPDGTYTITTSAMTATENYKITCTKAGYDVADGTFVAV
jgi:hypothetical protein